VNNVKLANNPLAIILELRTAAELETPTHLLKTLLIGSQNNCVKIFYSILKKPIGYVVWTRIHNDDIDALQGNMLWQNAEVDTAEDACVFINDVMFSSLWSVPAKNEFKKFLRTKGAVGAVRRGTIRFWLKNNAKFKKTVVERNLILAVPPLKKKLVLSHQVQMENSITADSISIVIPVKNNQAGIDQFLKIFSAQTKASDYPLEIIIVDNNSDEKIRVADVYPFNVKVFECKHRGPGAARNVGVKEANGKWILFTDSDCIATPSLISGYYTSSNQCVAYAGKALIQGDDALSNYYREVDVFTPTKIRDGGPSTIVTANCLVLKSAFTAINGFNERFIYAGGEDTDLGYRLRTLGKIEYNFNSVAIHEFDDGLNGFVNRFMRYGRGGKLLDDYYLGGIFKRVAFSHKKNTPTNKFLAETHQRAWDMGYKAEQLIDSLP
jgi:glycosyltransferase involved in cell wall biosynthesis